MNCIALVHSAHVSHDRIHSAIRFSTYFALVFGRNFVVSAFHMILKRLFRWEYFLASCAFVIWKKKKKKTKNLLVNMVVSAISRFKTYFSSRCVRQDASSVQSYYEIASHRYRTKHSWHFHAPIWCVNRVDFFVRIYRRNGYTYTHFHRCDGTDAHATGSIEWNFSDNMCICVVVRPYEP